MTDKCLVTQLKNSVNNSDFEKFGEFKIVFQSSSSGKWVYLGTNYKYYDKDGNEKEYTREVTAGDYLIYNKYENIFVNCNPPDTNGFVYGGLDAIRYAFLLQNAYLYNDPVLSNCNIEDVFDLNMADMNYSNSAITIGDNAHHPNLIGDFNILFQKQISNGRKIGTKFSIFNPLVTSLLYNSNIFTGKITFEYTSETQYIVSDDNNTINDTWNLIDGVWSL